MDANIVDLETLFKKPVSYRIPQFQRAYAWKEDSQWKLLWDDILAMANRNLNGIESGNNRPHFMGAIVLQSQVNMTGEVEKRIVVDGQQRLTTLQLLIKAAEFEFRGYNENSRAERLQSLTLNDASYHADDNDNDTKIRQSNRNDLDAFQKVIRDYSDPGIESSIYRAFEFFKKNVAEWLKQRGGELGERADALEHTVTKRLQIAAIDLDKDEEPHIIFETLNERGEPLTQADRVKNTVLYKAGVTDDASKARDIWGMFEGSWWRNNSSERRLTRSQNDRFLNHWLEMKIGDFIASDRVAAEFRNLLQDPNYSNIQDTAEDIRNAGKFFRDIEEGSRITEIQTFWARVKTLELGVVMPVLLWLRTSDVTGNRLSRTLQALESFMIRRMLCGMPSMGMRHKFTALLQALKDDGPDICDETMIRELDSSNADNNIWPNDRMLRESLTTRPLRGNPRRQTMILEAIESSLRTDKSETLNDKELTLEHIMPQSWERHWPLSADMNNSTEEIDRREKAVKELGNLTLVTQKLNSSYSNGSWDEKKGELHKHSRLFLNKNLLDDAPDDWNEETIRKRSDILANQIIQIWPHAAQL